MKNIQILSIPQVIYAHSYRATDYQCQFRQSPDKIEITTIVEGALRVESETGIFTAEKNDVLVNFFKERFYVTSNGVHKHSTVGIRVKYEETKNGGITIPSLIKFKYGGHAPSRLINEIIRNFPLSTEPRLNCSGMILELLSELNDTQKRQRENISPAEAQYVAKAKQYVSDHLHTSIEQRDIAAHLGITPEYLCSIFKKEEKETVMNFVHRIKLEAILNLMKKEKLKLYEACGIFGFSDPNYASRLFKKIYGKSAGELVRGE